MISLKSTTNLELLNNENLCEIKGGMSNSFSNISEDSGSEKKDVDSESGDSYEKD